jgi:thiol-disulfide isomerase/thioredoxin
LKRDDEERDREHGWWHVSGNCAVRLLVPAAALVLMGCEQPVTERISDARPAVVIQTPSGRVVHNPGAPERWVPRRGVPDRPSFLFSGVLAVAVDNNGRQAVLPPDGGRVVTVDGASFKSSGEGDLRRAIAVMGGGRDAWIVVERDGFVRPIPATGEIPVLIPSELANAVSVDGALPGLGLATFTRFGDHYVAARSAFASTMVPEPSGAPLLVELDARGAVVGTIDTTRRLATPTLTTIANAGHLAASDSLVMFAYLARDEIRAYDGAGRRRWTADRALLWPREPDGGVAAGAMGLSYRPVNLSITVRGDLLYALAYADSAASEMRLDAFDVMTGVLRRTAILPARPLLISLDERGALWYAPADTLATLSPPRRAPGLDFALPTPDGDTLRLRSYRGKVVLLNVWASWCGPCREEFPLMAALERDLAGKDFAVVAISDDLNERAARSFLAELEPPFAIAWSRKSLETTLRYSGLPLTIQLDRDGREIERYIGFGGEPQFKRIRNAVLEALGKP